MTIEELIRRIPETDRAAGAEAKRRWDSLAKPLGGLGVLEDDIVKIAAVRGSAEVRLDRAELLVFCADNGVTVRGVSQSDYTVTTAVAASLGIHDSTVNHLARTEDCAVLPVDIGMREDTPSGVMPCKVRAGTADICSGSAMSRAECERAICTGAELALQKAAAGADILLLGEMGIGNTTTTAAAACVLLGREAEETVGRGAGLSDDGLRRKEEAVRMAVAHNRPDPADPVDILQKVGGLDLAALCGACLGGAAAGVPVLLDGVITNVAALCAVRLCPAVREVLIASHRSGEPAAGLILEELGLGTCIDARMHLGEGSGGVLALGLLRKALAVYGSRHTFGALGIEAYTPQE